MAGVAKGTKAKKTRYEVLRVIREHMRENGAFPTVRYIAEQLGIKSTNTITHHLKKLETEDELIDLKQARVAKAGWCVAPRITRSKAELDERISLVVKMVDAKDHGDMETYYKIKHALHKVKE